MKEAQCSKIKSKALTTLVMINMNYKFLQEVTDWGSHNVANHVYIFECNQCVGYVKHGSSEIELFKSPLKQFSKTRRKFKDVTKRYS